MWKDYFNDVNIQRMILHFCFFAIYPEVEPVDIPFFLLARKIKICSSILQQLFAESRLVIFVSVWPNMKPDKRKRIGRTIGILYFSKAIQGMFDVV